MKKIVLPSILFSILLLPGIVLAQGEVLEDTHEILKARVVQVLSEREEIIFGTDTPETIQELEVEIVKGEREGTLITFTNDFISLDEGDIFYLDHRTSIGGLEYYSVYEPYRLPVLGALFALFLLIIFIFGGKQGLRGFVSLLISLVIIFFILLPGLLKGIAPLLLIMGVSSLIIILGSYITHGFNRTTTAAVIGMIMTIVLSGALATLAVHLARLTGFASEESIYLNFNTAGRLDFGALLLGGILIGLLGTLYDAAISQAVAVEEIHWANTELSKKEVYKRVLRIGREHIGALVDTLAIAYVGAALPLLLFFYSASSLPFFMTLNREVFATEIVRILVGSIGVILAVPITTLLSVFFLVRKGGVASKSESSQDSHYHVH